MGVVREKVKLENDGKGARNHNAKLSEKQVIKILKAKRLVPARLLAEKYEVTVHTINAIWQGKTWKYL